VKKYKKSLLFLIKFFVTYFLFFGLYSFYLNENQQKVGGFKVDLITEIVAHQTISVLKIANYSAKAEQHQEELSMKVLLNDVYVSRVIEGCNSVSIIILFIAFIVAFSGGLKETILYSFVGSILIYIINILRIAFLSFMLYKYPNQQVFLHNIVFPAIIYGFTFLLWVIWVKRFSNLKR
jgi:exosortase family protein XrtF